MVDISERTQKIPYREGVDIESSKAGIVIDSIVEKAKETFADSGLIDKSKDIGPAEVQRIHQFYREATQINPDVFNLSTQEHLLLVDRYARFIGSRLNQRGYTLNLDQLSCAALLHDIGRTISHRRGRNDRIGHLILNKSGVREDIIDMIPPDNQFFPKSADSMSPEEVVSKMTDISDLIGRKATRGIVMIADVLAKFKPRESDGGRRLRRWREVCTDVNARQNRPDATTMWPSELARQRVITAYPDAVAELYRRIGDWAAQEMGIDSLEAVVDQMEWDLHIIPLPKTF